MIDAVSFVLMTITIPIRPFPSDRCSPCDTVLVEGETTIAWSSLSLPCFSTVMMMAHESDDDRSKSNNRDTTACNCNYY